MRTRPRIDRVLPAKAARTEPDSALNLADLDPPVWHVMSGTTAHGPFTLGQLQAFADAGKIGPLTRISSGNGEPFLTAMDHSALRPRIEAALESRSARRTEASNFVIVSAQEAGAESHNRRAIGNALNALGRFAEPIPGTFVLRSDRPLSEVRRALAAASPGGTPMMILETRDARLGWMGLPAQHTESLRAVWDAPLAPPAD